MYTVSSLPSWHCWPKVQMKVCRAEPLCQRAKIEKGRLGAKSQTAQARHSKWLNYNNVWTECTPFCIDWTAWFFSFYNVYTSVRWPTLYLDSQSATKIQQQDQYNLYCSTTNTINTTSNTTNPVHMINTAVQKSLLPSAPWSTDQCKFQGTNFNWTQSTDW